MVFPIAIFVSLISDSKPQANLGLGFGQTLGKTLGLSSGKPQTKVWENLRLWFGQTLDWFQANLGLGFAQTLGKTLGLDSGKPQARVQAKPQVKPWAWVWANIRIRFGLI